MLLAIDIGNTSITLGGFCGDELRFVAHLSTDRTKTEDEYAILMLQALTLYGIERTDIRRAIVASVVPPLNRVIKQAIRQLFGQEPLFVGPGIKSGIGIQCDIPSSVGADLIAASVAAYYIHGGPALIVDIDTVTKMTVVNRKGAFVGTSIIPGVLMGLNAMAEQTAQLPRIGLEVPPTVIAKNTADCMRSGVLYGNASMIDGMIDRIREEFGEELPVYVTGDQAPTVIPLCKHAMLVDEHLVLKGLELLNRKNRP